MDVVLTVARFTLAGVWAVAAIGKLLDWKSIPLPLVRLGGPGWLTRTVAMGLPVLELGLAVLLLSGSAARIGAIVSAVLLTGFVVVLTLTLDRGSAAGGCGCLGRFERTDLPVAALVRAELLAALAAGIVWLGWERPFPSLILLLMPAHAWQWLMIASAVGAVLLRRPLAVGWGRFGEFLASRRQPGPTPAAGLPVGTEAPIAYRPKTLEALVFIRDRCAPCEVLLGSLPQPAAVGAIRILSVSGGGAETAAAYRVPGVPSAVLIGSDGKIASTLAVGVPAVRSLLARK